MRIFSTATLVLAGACLLPGPFVLVHAEISSDAAVFRGKSVSFYVSQLHTETLRAGALRSIGSFGSQAVPAIPQLIAALGDTDVEVRIAAAWALSQVGQSVDENAVRGLARALTDADPKVRSLAAVALREAGPGAVEAMPALIAALNDSASYVRSTSADALGRIGPAAHGAVVPLIERIGVKDEQVFVLRSLSTALGNIGPGARSAIPALTELRKVVRASSAAEEAIHKINGEPVATYW